MKLKFTHNGQSGILYATEGELHQFADYERQLKTFVNTHAHRVLRDHFDQWKTSCIQFVTDSTDQVHARNQQTGEEAIYTVALFFAPADHIKEYLDIISKELHVEIER